MASSAELVNYIAQQCSGAGEITVRKMFGEYGIYLNGTIFGLICDDQLFIKITDAGKKQMPNLETGFPYEGAREHFLFSDIDNREALTAFVLATCGDLPGPKRNAGKKMAFDFKKEQREYYQPPRKPGILSIPAMHYIAVRGKGNPNEEGGAYKTAVGQLYTIAYTLKMSRHIEGGFPYVVPPLEGLWWQKEREDIDYSHKEDFQWIAMIRLPDFVQKQDVDWAIGEAEKKKKMDFGAVEFFSYAEGLCVQCMHLGSYDQEPATIAKMNAYLAEHGYAADFASGRYHHEIYLSDPRKCAPERCRTVLRQPVKKQQ